MTPERYQRLGQLYRGALALAAADRPAFLDAACGSDRDLRREVESMLAAPPAGEFQHEPAPAAAPSGNSARSLSPGSRIGRYQIVSLLGRGGMGEVYLAHDPTLGRNVAVKLVRTPLTSSPLALHRFEYEARAASSLNHPNIITVYEIGESDEGRFIAMEVVEGRPLSAMTGKAIDVAELIPIARQLAQALAVAHAAGIVHRDIKPENIILRPDRYVKVLDFGVARLLSGSSAESGRDPSAVTHPGVLVGTPRYMSPEQLRGEAASPASDIFALGMVLYELVTGRHPVSAPTTTGARTDQSGPLMSPSHWVPDVPLVFEQLVLRMLEPEPARRPDAVTVDSALASIGAGVPTHRPSSAGENAGTPPKSRTSRERPSHHRWLLPGAALVVLLVGAMTAARSGWLTPSPPPSAATAGAGVERLKATQITANPAIRRVVSMALSPDGKYVGYSDPRGVHLRAIDTTDSQLLPDTDRMTVRGWSADSTRIFAMKSGRGVTPGQWSISLAGNRERMAVGYPSPDGTRVVSVSGGQLRVSRLSGSRSPADADTSEIRVDLGSQTTIYGVEWSPSGRWLLAAIVTPGDAAQNRGTIERVDPVTGERGVVLQADQVGRIRGLAVSRSGVIFYSQGRTGIWSTSFDDSTGTRRGAPQRLTPSWNDVEIFGIEISADGKRLLFLRAERQRDVHVGRLARSGIALDTLERLPAVTSGSGDPSSWAADGRSIYFSSNLSGDEDVHRQVVGEDQPHLLISGAGQQCCAQPTPDGKWILFRGMVPRSGSDAVSVLRRVPVGGLLHEDVLDTTGVKYHRCGFAARCIVTFVENNRDTVYDLDWSTGRRTRLMQLPAGASGEPDVSRDGQQLAFLVARAGMAPAIRIQEVDSQAWRDIVLQDAVAIRSVSWASDGRGVWAVALSSSEDTRVWYVPLRGEPVVLSGVSGILPVWVLPSPDGSRVALFSDSITSNVWMLEGF